MNAVAEILERTADLIEPEGRWTQGVGARDAKKRPTRPSDPDAVCWCITGALSKTTGQILPNMTACDFVLRAIGRRGDYGKIGKWNDAPERTQAEVVAKLREAAAKAREQGK